ncbi:hypothetical protein LOK49_LG13G00207 [Camellia lanceoleosa]|uniref:Uncharacterized protein n=1 Tax=Camellia lanceoleosa TaxID=1840588 RepID=A0ACC0FML3_9ERIC|nr:hypothetical protein LOK49_LG13G00207 [Camellia lanceoleosa]
MEIGRINDDRPVAPDKEDEEKMDKFFALIRNIWDARDRWRNELKQSRIQNDNNNNDNIKKRFPSLEPKNINGPNPRVDGSNLQRFVDTLFGTVDAQAQTLKPAASHTAIVATRATVSFEEGSVSCPHSTPGTTKG